MKIITPAIIKGPIDFNKAKPTTKLMIASARVVQSNKNFLPALASKSIPPKVAKKFTTPINPVI